MEDRVLSHHGTKGMRWGIRRYQNKDGTLTPAGKKRYDKEVAKAKEGIRVQKNKARTQAKLDKLEALKKQARGETDDVAETKVKAKSDTDTAPKKKTVKDMSDTELVSAIERAKLEDKYRELRPEQVSTSKKLMTMAVNDVILPSLASAGKNQLDNLINKLADKALKNQAPPKSQYEKLQEQYNILSIKKSIEDLKNPKPKSTMPEVKTWDDAIKKQTWFMNEQNKPQYQNTETSSSKSKTKNKTDNKSQDTNVSDTARKQSEYAKQFVEEIKKNPDITITKDGKIDASKSIEKFNKQYEDAHAPIKSSTDTVNSGLEYTMRFISEMQNKNVPTTSDGKFDSAKIIDEYNRTHGIK